MSILNISSLRLQVGRLKALSSRERAALAGLGAALAVAAALAAADYRAQQEDALVRAESRRAQAEAGLLAARDTAGLESLKRSASQAQYWSVVEPSRGVAEANVLASVQIMAEQAGLQNVEVGLAPAAPPPAAGGFGPGVGGAITVTLQSDFDWAAISALLRAMSVARLSFSIDAIERISGADGAARLVMAVSAPHLATGAAS